MTPERLKEIWMQAEGNPLAYGDIAGQVVLEIRDHISALESELAAALREWKNWTVACENAEREREELRTELATARDAALEEAARVVESADDGVPLQMLADDGIRALKSKPAHGIQAPEVIAVPAMPEGLVVMASEESGLLPKKRRREHEYGPGKAALFGSVVASCTRAGCAAYRVKTRTGKTTQFRQHAKAELTDEPGPCEVEP
jgi:hypothetical protein